MRLAVDTLEEGTFSGSGFAASVDLSRHTGGLWGEQPVWTVRIESGSDLSLGPWRFGWGMEGATVLGAEGPLLPFELGGFRRLSGRAPGALRGRYLGLLVGRIERQVGSAPLRQPLRLGVSVELGGAVAERAEVSRDALELNGSLYLAFGTHLGPLLVGFGAGDGDSLRSYVLLGIRP